MYKLLPAVLLPALAATCPTLLRADTYSWDGPNTVYDGVVSGGSGTWNTSLTNWYVSGVTNSAWTNTSTNSAVFGGTAGTVTVASGIANLDGLYFTTSGYTLAGASAITLNPAGGAVIDTGSGTATITAPLGTGSAGASFSKNGSGTLIMGSSNNTNLGAFSLNNGTVLANSSSNGRAFGSTVINIGDGIGAAGSALYQFGQNTNTPFGDGVVISLASDGRLDLNGKSIGGNIVFRSMTINFNGGSMVGNGNSTTGGGSLTTSSNNVSTATSMTFAGQGGYNAAGGNITLTSPGGGLVGTGVGGAVTLAVNNGAEVNSQGGDILLSSGNNGGTTQAGSITVSSTGGGLISTGNGALTFATGTNNLGTATSTISRTGVAGDSSTLTISGKVNLGLPNGSSTQSNRQLILNSTGIINTSTDSLVISAAISDGANNTGNGITKQGFMAVALTGTNTYTGSTSITNGSLYAKEGVGLPVGSLLALSSVGVLESNGTMARTLGTGAGELAWNGGGFSARGGDLTVAMGGTATPTALVVGTSTPTTMSFGSAQSDGRVNLVNDINFPGAQTVNLVVNDNASSIADYTEWSGAITGASGRITKSGAGTIYLSNNANSASTSTMTVSNGVIRATANGDSLLGGVLYLDSSSGNRAILETSGTFSRAVGTGANQLRFGSAAAAGFAAYGADLQVRLNNNTNAVTLGGGSFLSTSGTLVFGSATADSTVFFNNQLALGNSGTTFQVMALKGTSATKPEVVFTNTISGASSLRKTGAGRMAISSTSSYTGSTTVSEGTLLVTGGGSVNSTSGITVDGNGAEFSYSSSVGLAKPVTIGASGGKFTYNSSAKYTGGTITAGNGATVGGSGVLGSVAINSGGILSPGNSPGNLTADTTTWAGGGTYVWEINNAGGSEGVNWDLLTVGAGNNLDITATSGSKFTISLYGLTAGNTAGAIPGFDNSQSYVWTIATVGVGGNITGFDLNAFTIDASNFINNNPVGPGTFSLAVVGSDLNLVYSIPEPSTVLLLGLGFAGILLRRKRR